MVYSVARHTREEQGTAPGLFLSGSINMLNELIKPNCDGTSIAG